MDLMKKCLVVSGVGAMGLGLLLMVKAARNKNSMGMYEKVGKGIDEKLKESRDILDKATAHVQSVYEHIKNPK